MPRRKALALVDKPGEFELTEKQHQFMELLLTGKNITEAADEIGISRRAATYWLHDETGTFRIEYERRRLEMRQVFKQRIASILELALKAMEDCLAADAPPAIRWQAARFLYESQISRHVNLEQALDADDLVKKEVSQAKDRHYFEQFDSHYMHSIPE